MAQRDRAISCAYPDRAGDAVNLDHCEPSPGRQPALVQVVEEQGGLTLGDLRYARNRGTRARFEACQSDLVRQGFRVAGNRIAVGAGAWLSEQLVETPLDDLGHGMLEACCLFVRSDPIETEPVGQPALHNPVPPHDRLSGAPARWSELDLLAAVH